jgi:hypothetical protein
VDCALLPLLVSVSGDLAQQQAQASVMNKNNGLCAGAVRCHANASPGISVDVVLLSDIILFVFLVYDEATRDGRRLRFPAKTCMGLVRANQYMHRARMHYCWMRRLHDHWSI